MQYAVTFPTGTTEYLFRSNWEKLKELAPPDRAVIITDSNVKELYPERFEGYRTLVVPAGEKSKSFHTINDLAHKLIHFQAHRKTMLVGVGGGVVTDITGFLASIYMRGVPCGFVPTTLLGMVDAAVGGKNGINIELHKNMLGTIRQPKFILYDASFLSTLTDTEWSNGFAEIIKYGCISDVRILNMLESSTIQYFQKRPDTLNDLIMGCVDVKNKIVHADEGETGVRKLLNFGHTSGHAFETLYHIPHGYSVALGMVVACRLSEEQTGLSSAETEIVRQLLVRYQLPTHRKYDIHKMMEILRMDKKRNAEEVDYILLHKLGKACIKTLPFETVETALSSFIHAGQR
ncbi:3-dehydroquinate synthase [Taibaiella soli]|uniref:3-dehydroquinate synthase n=1 Tax=Taibaiella soli TaxID=1649169 RepID=A0A2W2AXP2_9BACT|nr:3-dehydroquinate synthase [Taibaiella soli]PZF72438.1 3-dehydroquinate synthase [Taibaiella soli]